MSEGSYWPSIWPVESGDNQRSKAVPSTGLALDHTDRLVATTRLTGRWPVMFIQRDRGQLYLQGTSDHEDAEAAGWVELVDPTTLLPLASSGDLPTGGHEWSGSLVAHHNGDLYTVNGAYLHRLGADCQVRGELALPVDHAHSGLLILSDGSIVTKDTRLGSTASTLTVCDPDLNILVTAEIPEASMARLTIVSGVADDNGGKARDDIYVVGTTRIFRYRWDGKDLTLDAGWQPEYRKANKGGIGWEASIVDGHLWLADNGSVDTIQRRFSKTPTVRPTADELGVVPDSLWNEPVRLIGIALDDDKDVIQVMPTENSGGWVLASPLVYDNVAIAWDTCSMGMAAFDVSKRSSPEMLWYQPFRPSMQPLLFPATGELVINDYRLLSDDFTSDDLVVLDLRTGYMKSRVATGADVMSSGFLCPGWDRDVYYCTAGAVARIHAESML